MSLSRRSVSLAATLLLLIAAPAHALTIVDVGPRPADGSGFTPKALNNSDVIAEESNPGSSGTCQIWKAGAVTPILSGTYCTAGGINDAGQVTGIGPDGVFLWQAPGPAQAIEAGSAVRSGGINNGGLVAFVECYPSACGPQNNPVRSFTWLPPGSGISPLPGSPANPGYYHLVANGISNSGVVGSNDSTNLLWPLSGTTASPGIPINLDTAFEARPVNNKSDVVGSRNSDGHAALRLGSDGSETDLGSTFRPEAINDSVQVVGSDSGRATLWFAGTATDLNTLLPAGSGWVLENAVDINSAGDIVGTGTLNGAPHSFLLQRGLVVNDAGDKANADPSGKVCDDGSGNCTLRGAIQAANALGGAQKIKFNIPGTGVPKISPATPLPPATAQVTIDGTSQPGTPAGQPGVEIDGSGAGDGAVGLRLKGGASVVRGLILNGFKGDGILLEGAGGDTIAGDWIGTRAGSGGFTDVPNAIGIAVKSPDATIGGADASSRNVIADAGDAPGALRFLDGIDRSAPPAAAALEGSLLGFGAGVRIGGGGDRAQVLGNWVGLHPDGSRAGPIAAIGHTALAGGIQVAPEGAAVMTVTISGNVVTDAVAGIDVAAVNGSATGVTIRNNVVGPDSSGAVADILGNGIGITAAGHAPSLVVGGAGSSGNLVQGNALGVSLAAVDGAVVSGNQIGVGAPLSQLFDTLLAKSPNPGLHNVVGVALGGASHTTLSQNQVLGNILGVLVASGPTSRANQITGNTIGFIHDEPPRTVQTFPGDKLGSIVGILEADAPGDVVSGNTIQLTGIGVLAIRGHGVTIQGNLLSTNVFGILAAQIAASAIQGNTLVRNVAGLIFAHHELTPTELRDINAEKSPVRQADRTAAIDSPGSSAGLAMLAPAGGADLTDKSLGLASPGTLASADRPRGATAAATPGFGANITGNLIGTDSQSRVLGNFIGAWLIGDVTGSFAQNTVANNDLGGLWVGPAVEGHFPTVNLSRNSFRADGGKLAKETGLGLGLGLDLLQEGGPTGGTFGVTPNDAGDADVGPNGLQNFPDLASAVGTAKHLRVVGSLNSHTHHHYTVELFASAACHASGFGEGQTYLKSIEVITDAAGVGMIDTTLALPLGLSAITATATGGDGTSEFSQCLKPGGTATVSAAIAPAGLTPDGSGNVTVDVWCLDGKPCSGKATVQLGGSGHAADRPGSLALPAARRLLGSVRFAGGRGGRAVKVRIHLTPAARKLLKRRKHLNVIARVELRGRRGKAAHGSIGFVLSSRRH